MRSANVEQISPKLLLVTYYDGEPEKLLEEHFAKSLEIIRKGRSNNIRLPTRGVADQSATNFGRFATPTSTILTASSSTVVRPQFVNAMPPPPTTLHYSNAQLLPATTNLDYQAQHPSVAPYLQSQPPVTWYPSAHQQQHPQVTLADLHSSHGYGGQQASHVINQEMNGIPLMSSNLQTAPTPIAYQTSPAFQSLLAADRDQQYTSLR